MYMIGPLLTVVNIFFSYNRMYDIPIPYWIKEKQYQQVSMILFHLFLCIGISSDTR